MVRPIVLLATQSIIQVFAGYMDTIYGCMYILFTMFPQVFGESYQEKNGMACLN